MADAVQHHREAAAEAQQHGDNAAANEAYRQELQALSGTITADDLALLDEIFVDVEVETDTEVDTSDIESAETSPGDDETRDAEPEGDEASSPIPVELTSSVYADFKEAYDEDAAALLQNAWGDKAVPNIMVVKGLMGDHPAFEKTYTEFQTEDGGLSADGIQVALGTLIEKSDFKTAKELSAAHPELDRIFLDNFDEATNTLSPVGLYAALNYIARKSGYRHVYRNAWRSQPSDQQKETTTMNETSREDFNKGMLNFNERIERAQAEGDSRTANEVYTEQMEWIAKVKGNGPIVNGRRTA